MPDKKAELLKAATYVFAQKGYRGASTRAIAMRAQANEGSIYRLFGSKRKLYGAVLKAKVEAAGSFVSLHAQSSPEEFLAAWLKASQTDFVAMRLLHFAILEGVPQSRKLLKPSLAQLGRPVAEYVDGLKERGIIRREIPTPAAALALACLGACSLFFDLLEAGDWLNLDPAALPQLCAQIWLDGVGESPERRIKPAVRASASGPASAVPASGSPQL